ncbi:outer membrane protein Iml2/Tetratricopeptide repeat protein 39, partial [Blyttiomyces helicus]
MSDIAEVEVAVSLFLDSRFSEAERLLKARSYRSLYHTLGYGVIGTIKALLTFEPQDVDAAMDALKAATDMASACRKEQGFVAGLASMVTGAGRGGRDGSNLKNMTSLQRHAELAYAEAYLLKAVLSLVTDTNMVAFVREGLNIRSAYAIYKGCYKFLEKTFEDEGSEGLERGGIDEHFVSGVLLGQGGFNLVLSMMPPRVLRLFEMIGFSGDREFALTRLEMGGGWPPTYRAAAAGGKGLRKFMCDLMLLMYHVILSSMVQLPDCNIPFAKRILEESLKNHPESFLFRTLRGRLFQTECHADLAVTEYRRVISLQKEWRQLVHICVWDMATCEAAQGHWAEATACYTTLFEESRWSKAIYRYVQAVMLYASDPEKNRDKVGEMLKEVPKLTQKIAGKSIPLEKFVSRKARKFHLQDRRLFFPWLEILYIFNGFD